MANNVAYALSRSILKTLPKEGDALIRVPYVDFQRRQVATSDIPDIPATERWLRTKLKPHLDTMAMGQQVDPRYSGEIIEAYVAAYALMADAIIKSQTDALAAGRFNIVGMSDFFDATIGGDFNTVLSVLEQDAKSVLSPVISPEQRANITKLIAAFRKAVDTDAANVKQAEAMSKADAKARGALAPSNTTPAPLNDNKLPILMIGGVVLAGFLLWKFFRR